MAAPYSTDLPGVYVEGLEGSRAIVTLEDYTPGLGETPDAVRLSIIGLTLAEVQALTGKKVIVYRGDPAVYVFVGYIRRTHRRGPAGASQAKCWATDIRTDLQGIIIGQQTQVDGEYPGEVRGGMFWVGSHLVFNEDFKPNRSASALDSLASFSIYYPDVYRFAEPGANGYWWTVREQLATLVNWFVPYRMLDLNVELLESYNSTLRQVTTNVSIEFESVSRAITKILQQVGLTWTIRWDKRDSNLYPTAGERPSFIVMGQDLAGMTDWGAWLAYPSQPSGTPANTPAVPVADTESAIVVADWEMTESIDNIVTTTEVIGGETLAQILWTYIEDAPATSTLMSLTVPDGKQAAYAFIQNPANFIAGSDTLMYTGAAGDGDDVDTNGAKARWLSDVRNPAADILGAAYDDKDDISLRDCLYVFPTVQDFLTAQQDSATGTVLPWRVKAGFQIDRDHGVIYLGDSITIYSGSGQEPIKIDLDSAPYAVYLSTTTVLPRRAMATSTSLAPVPFERTRVVYVGALRSYVRERAMLPEVKDVQIPTYYDGVPSAWTQSVDGVTGYANRMAAGEGEPYSVLVDATPELQRRATVLQDATGNRRFRGSITFARAPWLHIGDRIYWPVHNPGFPTYTRIYNVRTNFTEMQTTIEVSENFL